ncbi:MAG: hypothetical protein K2I92_04815 [Muribaculaceae bacterium]|nr:hypothetical protein [Muribaculaceae bacterium]
MTQTFSSASAAWSRLAGFRADRARCKRFVYGEQWDDLVPDGQGMITEAEYIRNLGQLPMKNNILRRILRNVIGLYRSQYKVPCLSAKDSGLSGRSLREANAARRRWFQENHMEELAPRLLEEFLISGIVAVKAEGRRILPVTPDNFFFHSAGYDPRGLDIDLIGERHTVGFGTLMERFCESADDYLRLIESYPPETRGSEGCLIIEVWHKEWNLFGLIHDREKATLRVVPIEPATDRDKLPDNRSPDFRKVRTFVKSGWRRTWYASDGTMLRRSGLMERHPYIFKAYPFLDGEVHSYIGDLIDQQKYVNRLITLYDFIMKSSAKGVLLFPDECIPTGMDLQDVADEWSRFNGVIPFKAKPGVPLPTQVSGNAANIGITDLLKVEMQMLEDISGVSPTLQGKLTANSTSGTLFAQQNAAAQTSLLDILRSFTDFLSRICRNIIPGSPLKP